MANFQARSFIPVLPRLVEAVPGVRFSAAALKDIRNRSGKTSPANGTLDKVGRYGLIRHEKAMDIVSFVNAVGLPVNQKPLQPEAIVDFDCYIPGIGAAKAYLESTNGQHLDVDYAVSGFVGYSAEVVSEVFRSKLFPQQLCDGVVAALLSQFGIRNLRVLHALPSAFDHATPSGLIVQDYVTSLKYI